MSKERDKVDLEERLIEFGVRNQLISIFVKSIGTAKKNKDKTS